MNREPLNRELLNREPMNLGLTLVEVMVTFSIFLLVALFMFMAVREVTAQWTIGERRRVVYEKGAGILDIMTDDIRLAVTQEPRGTTTVKVKFIGDVDPQNMTQQRLAFTRAFESGPERAITFAAGDGRADNLRFEAPIDSDDLSSKFSSPLPSQKADNDEYNGLQVGDFKALGGLAMVGYTLKNQTLYRHIHAPVPQTISDLFSQAGQALATDVLYLAFDYWSQETQMWEKPAPNTKIIGPEKIWDSTRGISAPPLNKFFLHRNAITLNDPEDDVFPQKVRITITVDSSMPRCVFTKLIDDIGESDNNIAVDGSKGFESGDDNNDAFILIDNEWLKYSGKTMESFKISQRGARGTRATGHRANAIVRAGKTFRRVVYIPNFREDFTKDESYYARNKIIKN